MYVVPGKHRQESSVLNVLGLNMKTWFKMAGRTLHCLRSLRNVYGAVIAKMRRYSVVDSTALTECARTVGILGVESAGELDASEV